MKINRSVLVAVAMMVGATAAMGCAKPEDRSDKQESAATAPASTAADQGQAPVAAKKDENATIVAKASVGASTPAARPAPPPERYEFQGRAPSRDHEWVKGHWRWSDTTVRYEWVPGRWVVHFAPSAPPPPRIENPGRGPSAEHVWIKGHWQYSGREWTWVSGRWEVTRRGQMHVPARWEQRQGRWHYVPGHWERSR